MLFGRAFKEEWSGKSLGLSSWSEDEGGKPPNSGFLRSVGTLAVALVKPAIKKLPISFFACLFAYFRSGLENVRHAR